MVIEIEVEHKRVQHRATYGLVAKECFSVKFKFGEQHVPLTQRQLIKYCVALILFMDAFFTHPQRIFLDRICRNVYALSTRFAFLSGSVYQTDWEQELNLAAFGTVQ